MRHHRALAAFSLPLLVLASYAPAPAAGTSSLPARVAPSGLSTKDEPGGGRIVSGLVPNATSSIDATRDALLKMRGYFDRRPTVRGAVASSDRRSSIVLFDASLRGAPVRGLIVAAAQTGAAEVAFLFDDPKRLEGSLAAMERDLPSRETSALGHAPAPAADASATGTLLARWNAAAAHASSVALQQRSFSDNSGAIGIAPGFTLQSAQVGSFTATSPDGAIVRGEQSITGFDPNSPGGSNVLNLPVVAYSSDVGTAWLTLRRAAIQRQGTPDDGLTIESRFAPSASRANRSQTVVGRAKGPSGEPMTYIAWVQTVEPTRGLWTVTWSIVWSPESTLPQDGPKLLAMLKSYRGNQGVINADFQSFNEQFNAREQAFTRASVASNEASRIRLERNSAEALAQSADAQDWIRREGASTIHMLRNDDQVFAADGSHATVPLGSSLGYGSVPISQYIEGVDY
jgi:hypothetical protein